MEDRLFEIIFSRKALSKIGKHSANVYPLEAYGLLLGTNQPSYVYAALPVGQTARYGDPVDRFHLIPSAFEVAQKLISSLQMEISGLYHSHAEITTPSPLDFVPAQFIDCPVLILPVWGGELLFMSHLYRHDPLKGWQEQDANKTTPTERSMRFNPKRIGTLWNRLWGVVEYHRSYQNDL
jgi:proteasome lid subunit RPN8/RPN11